MKFRNFIIVLLAILMVFAFASCNNEPEKKSGPTKLYKLTATTGRNTDWNGADKFSLVWVEEVDSGDKLTLKYRSTAELSTFSIRNGSCAWVYEKGVSNFTSYEVLEDGWISVSYEFSDTFLNGDKAEPDYGKNTTGFRIDLRGNILEGDVIEYKDVAFNGTPLAVAETNVAYHQSKDEIHPDVYGAVNPTFAVIDDHEWTQPSTHVVFFASTQPGDDNLPFAFERVEKNTAFKTDLSKANYSFALFEDAAFTKAFAADTPITADMTIFVKYTGDAKTVTFKDGDVVLELEPTSAAYGSLITAPIAPDKENKLFRGWFVSTEENAAQFDFDTTKITDNLVLYARYEDPITVTFVADGGVPAPEAQKILSGTKATKPATDPEKDNYEFLGWFVSTEGDAAAFNFTTAITTDTSVYAKYREAQKFTVTFNLNYAECPEAATEKIYDGKKVARPDDPEREGFIFDTWTVAAAAESDAYDFDAVVTADLPLYAQWITPIDVTLNFNDGVSANKVVKVAPGTALDEPANPVRANYRFDGWFTAAEGGTKVDFTATVSEAKTIYAHWTAVYYQLTVTTGMDGIEKSKNEKFQLNIDLRDVLGEEAGIQSGDVLTLKIRSSRDFYDYDIRTNKKTIPSNSIDIRWVYEGGGDTSHFTVSEPVSGWRTVTFTFGTKVERDREGSTKRDKAAGYTGPAYTTEQYYNIGLNLRGYLLDDDVLEIKDVTLTRSEDKYDIPLKSSYNAASFTSYAEVEVHEWTIPTTHAVVYADADVVYNGTYHVEAVADGGYATGMNGTGYTYYSDVGKTVELDIATTPITEDTIIYFTLAE